MAAPNQSIAQAMTRYSPQVQQQARRSQYLTDALAAMQSSGENIRSPWELAAKLAGVALLNRGANKAQDKLSTTLKGEKDARLAKLMAGLPEQAPAPVAPMPAPQPPTMVAPPQAQMPPPQPPSPAPMPMAQGPQAPTGPDEQLIAITAQSESRNRDLNPDGSVVTSPAGARGRMQVMDGTNRDPGFGVRPAQGDGLEERARVGRDYLMAMRDRYGGDMAKAWGAYNWGPGNLDSALRAHGEEWLAHAPSETQAYVAQNLKALGQQPAQMAAQPASAPVAPYEVAALGPTPPPPSDPGRSPPDAGAAAAGSPQAPAAANPQTYQPTAQEVLLVRRLLSSGDPEEQARGEGLYWKLMERMTQAVEWETTTVNGVPAQVNKTTGELRLLQMPDGAKTQTVEPPPGVTPGTVMQQKPTGEMSVLQAPPSGYQGAPGQQSYIRGGPNDPAAGGNLVANEGKLRDDYAKEIQPYVIAREGLNKVIEAAKTGNPAGDIALVFGYMKTLDPGSTVREGEQAQVANSGTIPQTVTNIYNKLLTGAGSLSPAQRAQFADSAYRQFQVYEKTFQAANDRYSGLAQGYNFDPNRIVRQFDPIEPYKAPTPAAGAVQYPAAVTQAHQNMRARGLYDPKAPLGSERRPLLAADDASLRAVDTPQNKGKWVIGPDGRKGQIQ